MYKYNINKHAVQTCCRYPVIHAYSYSGSRPPQHMIVTLWPYLVTAESSENYMLAASDCAIRYAKACNSSITANHRQTIPVLDRDDQLRVCLNEPHGNYKLSVQVRATRAPGASGTLYQLRTTCSGFATPSIVLPSAELFVHSCDIWMSFFVY